MTIILYTDASTKGGHSCMAFKNDHNEELKTIIRRTSNSAAMELGAVYYGLRECYNSNFSNIMVVSDFLPVVKLINGLAKFKKLGQKGLFANYYNDILLEYKSTAHNIQAIWVASKCPLAGHQEVDQASKKVLQEYLLKRK